MQKAIRNGAANDLKPVPRSIFFDFTSVKGLTAKTGLEWDSRYVYATKELTDNGLDSIDRLEEANIDIDLVAGKKYSTVRVKSNSRFVAPIKQIFDFHQQVSSKYFTIAPSRGSYGSALQFLACMSSLRSSSNAKSDGYVKIESNGKRYIIRNVRLNGNALNVDISETRIAKFDGSVVECRLSGEFSISEAEEMLRQFIVLNPHVNFTVNSERYDKLKPLTLMKDTSIDFYTYEDFADLVTHYPDEEPHKFVSRFNKLNVRNVLRSLKNARKMADVNTKDLYKIMKRESQPIKAIHLGLIGRAPIEARLEQIFGRIAKSGYVTIRSKTEDGVPFVAEAVTAVLADKDKVAYPRIWFGINQSVPPKEHNVLHNYNLGKQSLQSLLKKSGIDLESDDPVVVVVHLHIPRILFKSYSKSAVDIPDEAFESLFRVIKKSSRFYKQYKKQDEPVHKIDWNAVAAETIRWVLEQNNDGFEPIVREIYYHIGHKARLFTADEMEGEKGRQTYNYLRLGHNSNSFYNIA